MCHLQDRSQTLPSTLCPLPSLQPFPPRRCQQPRYRRPSRFEVRRDLRIYLQDRRKVLNEKDFTQQLNFEHQLHNLQQSNCRIGDFIFKFVSRNTLYWEDSISLIFTTELYLLFYWLDLKFIFIIIWRVNLIWEIFFTLNLFNQRHFILKSRYIEVNNIYKLKIVLFIFINNNEYKVLN